MHKLNVLLVDDEPNVLKSLKRVFIDTNYRVLTAGSGKEGLEICAKEKLALVISDYRMSEMTGVQFLAKVKELHPDIVRIILSGYADVSAIVEAINQGQVYRFLSKPWNDTELLETVKHSLEHYRLKEENTDLLAELRVANEGLKELTDGLELKVVERTRDLELQNRATQTAQKILNLLPAGVIGIDEQSTIVYMNAAISTYISTNQLMLGEKIEWDNIEGPLKLLRAVLKGEAKCEPVRDEDGIRIMCTSLPQHSGVICLFSFVNMDDHRDKFIKYKPDNEAAHVE